MMSYKILALTFLSCAVQLVAGADSKPPATLYTKEPCTGQTVQIPADNSCVLLSEDLQKNINGAKLPEDVVCNFFTDEKCETPLYYGMEDPGDCNFSTLEIADQTVSVQCYDGSSIYDE
ncbi:hypothetical protein N7493_005093 [Penicillium malachiteum]|uniref:Uncharacterized protein n=1 Tax=Penicillium malachiteum TaxID=1324776 RepID=A0AAD6MW80_9EURO|nr:hypothetical protein N7493_005093 [Penicillium malachiteum]